jgi:hypothetical protein
MIPEQLFFLNLLSDHINRRKTTCFSESFDWNKILYYAQIHQVEGIVYYQCKNFLPDEFKICLEDKYGSSLSIYANQEYYIRKIKSKLNAAHIECFVVKGFPVASYYPFPPLRTMGDTDLVVHLEDRQRVHEILLEQGYVNESCSEGKEWVYFIDKYVLELHYGLIYSEAINSKIHEEYFFKYWDYVHNGVLDWNYHFIYLILHLRKHLMNRGVGFRQFLDIAVITRNNIELNWGWIEEQLVKLNLVEFSRTVFALNESWFDVMSPIQIRDLDIPFFDLATEQIFKNGVFGLDNYDNKDNFTVNNVRKSNHSKFSMFVSAVHLVFPDYSSLITDPKYSFIKGKKWLLPFAWIYRIIRGSKKDHLSRNVSTVKSAFVSKETINKREEYLKQWGLIE